MSPPCQRHTIPQKWKDIQWHRAELSNNSQFLHRALCWEAAYICLGGAILEGGIRASRSWNASAILCGSKETAEFYRKKRHCHDSMYRTAPFQNPATARTAGSCERTGATKAPVLSPAAPFVPRKASRGEETGSLCTGGTAAQDWPETAGRGRDAVPPRRRAHSRSHGQTGGQWQREKMFFLCIAHQELICGRSCALRFF